MRQTADSKSFTHGTFPVIFRGQGVEDVKEKGKKADKTDKKGKEKGKKQCVCSSMHLYCNCYYLNKSRRPSG
jgi:hypothetical protein